RASNALHRPSGESMPSRLKPMNQSGVSRAFTPPTSASGHFSTWMLWQARCSATSADEQAVSTAALGPLKSNEYEMRLAAMLSDPPVFEYVSIVARARKLVWRIE